MIKLKKLNGKEFILNCNLIETITATPDTVINTVEGKVYVVLDSVEEVVSKVVEYKGKIINGTNINRCDESEL